jgi:GrpB-like predicted nucleotidyltransferase (UPF0157 family)
MKVQVVPPDPKWKERFEAEASSIRSALGDAVVKVHQNDG